jgi:hypothetical protein
MADERQANDAPEFNDLERAWIAAHLPELRRSASDASILKWFLGAAFVLGLAAHAAGYLLKSSAPSEPLGLMAELLYALGLALWTGVVVALFVNVFPEAKRRQMKLLLDAFETSSRGKGGQNTP